MNLDLSIQRMAYRETETQQAAQAQIAQKRAEFEARLLRENVIEGDAARGAQIDSALRDMERDSSLREQRRAPPEEGTGTLIDRLV